MATDDIVVGLDIGTTKIACVVGTLTENNEIDVIGVGTSPCTGMKKGVVVNIEETIAGIEAAIEEAERMADVDIDSVYVGIGGPHIESQNNRGVIAITGQNREITEEDKIRVIEAAKAIAMSPSREIIHILPREYTVDDQTGIKDPVSMAGARLEVEVHIVTGATTSIKNVIKSVHGFGLKVAELVLQPLASGESILTPDEKDLGVAVVDIGGGTTDISVFTDGSIRYSKVIAIGGSHVTNDIAVGLRTTFQEAERLKISYASLMPENSPGDSEKVAVQNAGGDGVRQVSIATIQEIVSPRIEELMFLIKEELIKSGTFDMLPAGVVLTGGGSLLKGIVPFAEKCIGLPTRAGKPLNLKGLEDKVARPEFATAVGLLTYGLRAEYNRVPAFRARDGFFRYLLTSLKEWFRDVF